MRKHITGLYSHPKRKEFHETYSFNPPEGILTGTLDDRAWGKSWNLLCYFTEASSNEKYCLSFHGTKGYKPDDKSIAFDEEEIGTLYELTIRKSPSGWISVQTAKRLNALE